MPLCLGLDYEELSWCHTPPMSMHSSSLGHPVTNVKGLGLQK